MENLFTKTFDDDFREIGKEEDNPEEIGEYNHYPQMMPWIGNKYDNGSFKKILLIGESHYLPDCVEDEFKTEEGWYYQQEDDLDPESISWTDTREVVGIGPKKWTKGHTIYREVNKVIGDLLNLDYKSENMFQYVAYYNYFLRPAFPKGESFKHICTELDKRVAFNAFCEIVKIIKPDFIYFFSKFAWDSLHKFKLCFTNIEMDYSPHPASPWWNRKNYITKNRIEFITGKNKFKYFLYDNKVFYLEE